MRRQRALFCIAVLIFVLGAAPAVRPGLAAAPPPSTPTLTTIDVPGATFTQALGINNSGQIVGLYIDIAGLHGFLRQPAGTYTALNFPGAASTEAYGINTAGQVVGTYDLGGSGHGFVWQGGTFTTIDVPGATGTFPHGISDTGQIVGTYFKGGTHGFILQGGSFTTIDYPGARATEAYGINKTGQIVGLYFDGSQDHGYALQGRAIRRPLPRAAAGCASRRAPSP
ncbi:MAG: hypothetical protein E6H02_09110 [Bacillati bacterium ANGP1]|uniref:HAF repeat-containing protein n=1 Tax=Candidatus Segetimicrobium genomatis TaxID=2569760 RepID=A0A537LMW4_9BACT|nr:MAG: hypothetical protein E6H02_09110 [Terrabacteria group bacterium ANGP1]